MKVQFEKTDMFCGQANYGWVRREMFVLPDGTDDRVIIGLARKWAGYTPKNSRSEKMGGNDDIQIVPKGRAEVVFVTFDHESDDGSVPRDTCLHDVLGWSNRIHAADRIAPHLVSAAERSVAAAVWASAGCTTYLPGSMNESQDREMQKPPLSRDPARMPRYTWKPSPSAHPQGITPDAVVKWANDIRAAAHTEDKARITEREAVLADAIYLAQSTIGTPGEPLGCPTDFTPTPFRMTQEQYDADPTQGIDGQGA